MRSFTLNLSGAQWRRCCPKVKFRCPQGKVKRLSSGNHNLPEPTNPDDRDSSSNGGGNYLYIGELNYSPNYLTELRKLAERNPELAEKYIDNKERADIREDRSFRIALFLTVFMVLAIVGIGGWTVVNLGWLQSLVFIGILVAASHVVVAILKGEFSETSWLGRFVTGQKPKSDD